MNTATKVELDTIDTDLKDWDEVPKDIARNIADRYQWTDFIACSLGNAALFDEVPDQRGPSKQRRISAAMAICEQCPVRLWCLVEQMNATNISGDTGDTVRGGTLGSQRAFYRRKVASQLGLRGAKASGLKFKVTNEEPEARSDSPQNTPGYVRKVIVPA